MAIDFLMRDFEDNPNKPAVIWNDEIYNYNNLLMKIREASRFIERSKEAARSSRLRV